MADSEHDIAPRSTQGDPDSGLDTNLRWDSIIHDFKVRQISEKTAMLDIDNQGTPRQRMQRAVLLAAELMRQQQGEPALTSNDTDHLQREHSVYAPDASVKERFAAAKRFAAGNKDQIDSSGKPVKALKVKKALEEQHYLEMIDPKHRYGSNLQYYKESWERQDTQHNFLAWLDKGEGSELSLPECSREKLEKERILYLSIEQRRHYLTHVDERGLLRWSCPHPRNKASAKDEPPLVDTRPGRWADSNGLGILPAENVAPSSEDQSEEKAFDSDSSIESDDTASSSSSVSTNGTSFRRQDADPVPPANQDVTIPEYKSKTEKSNTKNRKPAKQTFIYVSDTSSRLYIGIKSRGHLQHSSFLAGGPITSAGTLVVHDGVIQKISPMSGHYRTKSRSFTNFIDDLRDKGCNLDDVHIVLTCMRIPNRTQRANTLHSVKKKAIRSKKDLAAKMGLRE